MSEWHQLVQTLIDETDACIRKRESDLLTLSALSRKLGYSEDTLLPEIQRDFRDALPGLPAATESCLRLKRGAGF